MVKAELGSEWKMVGSGLGPDRRAVNEWAAEQRVVS